jgi:hypothetical protein
LPKYSKRIYHAKHHKSPQKPIHHQSLNCFDSPDFQPLILVLDINLDAIAVRAYPSPYGPRRIAKLRNMSAASVCRAVSALAAWFWLNQPVSLQAAQFLGHCGSIAARMWQRTDMAVN